MSISLVCLLKSRDSHGKVFSLWGVGILEFQEPAESLLWERTLGQAMLGGSPGWWDRVEWKPALVMEQKYYVSQHGDLNTLPGKTHELKEVA